MVLKEKTQEDLRLEMMEQISETLIEYQQNNQILVNTDTGVLEFTDATFSSGSAVVNPATAGIVQKLAGTLKIYMDNNPAMEILIEGHTDPAVVGSVRNAGGYFANNIQLSALRAANVRETLLSVLGKDYSSRIGVAGYGDTRLKDPAKPLSPENRRVELRILWNGNDKG